MRYQLTGYVQLVGKPTTAVRAAVEANSQQEAEEKFKAFLLRKTEPIVHSCQVEQIDDFAKIMKMFGGIFK